MEALRAHLTLDDGNQGNGLVAGEDGTEAVFGKRHMRWAHPRWVRVNTVRSSLETQLATTFAEHSRIDSVEMLLEEASTSQGRKLLHVDQHVPNLIALPTTTDLSGTSAYRKGEIILQDKASCFPAYLLDPIQEDGEIMDTCAAPGNKTTHIAALLHGSKDSRAKPRIIACEKDKERAVTLQKMVDWAGVQYMVTVKAGQDFLRLNPEDKAYKNVGALLLDPSCSGSGIVGRDDMPRLVLPSADTNTSTGKHKNKRKRPNPTATLKPMPDAPVEEETLIDDTNSSKLETRLKSLSTFQLKLLTHSFRFPAARKITYSTCSIHAEENEHVVIQALESQEAQQRGWRILRRAEQVVGMREWGIRGDRHACERFLAGGIDTEEMEHIAEGCIRCEKGTKEGTMGFFVACFVRDRSLSPGKRVRVPTRVDTPEDEEDVSLNQDSEESEWQGFNDDRENDGERSLATQEKQIRPKSVTPRPKRKKTKKSK